MPNSKNKPVLKAFTDEWKKKLSPASFLYIESSHSSLFSPPENAHIVQMHALQEIDQARRYDFIMGDFPYDMPPVEWKKGKHTLSVPENWLFILKAVGFLEKKGVAMFTIENYGFSTSEGTEFEKALNEKGYYVNGYINMPHKSLQQKDIFSPVIVILSTVKTDSIFLAELTDKDQARQVVRNYFSGKDRGEIKKGRYIPSGDYSGFPSMKILEQIERLETQYKTYEIHRLKELALEINSPDPREKLRERKNAVYIPKIGRNRVVHRLEDTKFLHQNYFQVVLKESVFNEYVASFFRTAIGRLIIDFQISLTIRPHLNKKDVEEVAIALPSLEEQKTIVQTQNKLQELKKAIDKFDSEIALNPTISGSLLKQLNTMLDVIGTLTDADRVRSLVREGETKYVEFKQTFSLDVRKQTKERYMEEQALKNVAAFLNTDGGTLLIGVSDDGQIPGIDEEIEKFHKSLDKFLLHWKNKLKGNIGEEFYPFIDYHVIQVDSRTVLYVTCKPSKSPCYLKGRDFYVRINPATEKLEGPKLVEYITHHFK